MICLFTSLLIVIVAVFGVVYCLLLGVWLAMLMMQGQEAPDSWARIHTGTLMNFKRYLL